MGNVHMNKVIYLAGLGAVLFFLGLFFSFHGIDLLIDFKIRKSIVLEEGSEALKRFQKTPFPLEFKVYLFNITNPEEIMSGGKPVVSEVGPYTYDLYKEKPQLKFLTDGAIEYNMTHRFFFNQKKSGRNSPSDVFTVLNVPLVGTASMVEQTFPMGLSFLNNAIPFLFPNISNIFLTTSVDDLFFNGITITCNYSSGPAMPICNGLKAKAPPTMWREPDTRHYKFALFKAKNSSFEGPYKVLTGENDVSEIGQIVAYKQKSKLTNWDKNTTCTDIKGTDTTIFGPPKNPQDDLNIFVPDVCLSFSAKYVSTTIENGFPVNKYFSAEKNMASAAKDPANECRCTKDDDGVKHCLKDGAIDASPCQGVPVIFSNPHFLDADPEYLNGVEGLKPDESKHKTFVLMEPKTGAPIEGRKRMQMNLMVKNISGIDILANMSENIIPILWIEEGLRLEGPLLQELQRLYYVIGIMETFKWVLMAAGLVVLTLAALLYIKIRRLFCFAGTMMVTPVDSVAGAQKMNTFGITNQGSDDYDGSHGLPSYPGNKYPKLSPDQGKNGEIVNPNGQMR